MPTSPLEILYSYNDLMNGLALPGMLLWTRITSFIIYHPVSTSYWVSIFLFFLYISHWMEADSHSVLDDTLKNCLNSTHSLNIICQRSREPWAKLGLWIARNRGPDEGKARGQGQARSLGMNKTRGKEATAELGRSRQSMADEAR